jgi:hypothetical protein
MSALLDAARWGDLERVKQLIMEGADVAEATFFNLTALLEAAFNGHTPIMKWLLDEGGSSLAEKTDEGEYALSLAALNGQFATMQFLLEERGASPNESSNNSHTVWSRISLWGDHGGDHDAAELSSLLKVMVMLEDAPADFITRLSRSPQDADICTRGRQFRAQLPSYLEQQRAKVAAHCPLPAVLQSLVAAYSVTTSEDMWTDGLRAEPKGHYEQETRGR